VVQISGIDGIAFTKLDVLDTLEEIKLCVGYQLEGETLNGLPSSAKLQASITPIYETLAGWQRSTRGIRSLTELPAEAVRYVRRVEELVEAPIALLSTGADREDTIVVADPFSRQSI